MKSLCCLLLMGITSVYASDESLVERYLKYKDLTRITEQKFDMVKVSMFDCIDPKTKYGPHLKPGIHIYVNDVALEGKRKSGEFPLGALIVKEKFEEKQDEAPNIITVMEKIGNTGKVDDWQFHMIRVSDRSIIREGFKVSCVECHARFTQTDFVSRQTSALLDKFLKKNK